MTSLTERTSHPRARRYGAWTGAASLAACLTVVLGGGIANTANAATVDSAAAPATVSIAVNSADRIDWPSVVEPALNCPKPRPRAAWYVVHARVAAVGDLTRDGKRETVVVSSCPSSTSSNPLIAFVYDGASKPSAPRLLGKLGKNRYFKSLKVAIQGGRVQLHGKALSDQAPRCCPDLMVSQIYKWDGTQFRKTADKANRIT
ncbi:hypothetical protein ACQP2T_49050 [Nonomuraea sp. CA-143628]|uniref:hypothetical protein n=1 Tax=Nonomuraea sp. CA-143628 TaxID=3239997 RepID=UPI003D8ED255